MPPVIHRLAEVQSLSIGRDTHVWQFCVILPGAVIGERCNICAHCFVENDVVIGNDVTIKSGVYIWDGIRLEDGVFVGPNVTFTNDHMPRSKRYPQRFETTVVKTGASIGAGAIILPGIRIGAGAMVAAGSVVTSDVQERALVAGIPARFVRTLEPGE